MKAFCKSVVVKILSYEAKVLLNRHKPTIVCVTGNVGKTTTKDAIYSAIKNSVSARKSEKSFNSEIGVPITVLGLHNAWGNPLLWIKNILDGFFIAFFSKEYPAVLVLEMGIDRPGDMERLSRWIRPDVVVLTRLPSVPVHVEYFQTPEAVITEKMKLVSALKVDGTLVYNHDDMLIQQQLGDVLQRSLGFSRYIETDYMATDDAVIYSDDVAVGMQCTITHAGESIPLQISGTVGTQHAYACAAAVAVADVLGISLEEAVTSLKDLRTPNGRARLIPGIKSTMIIDDTYNSSPTACELALQTLSEMKHAKRKIAVLGDMLELGRFSSEEHEKIGALVARSADMLLTVGVRARKIAEGALNMGMPEDNILQYDDSAQAGRELQALLQYGDVVLVKASQGIRAERIVEEVMADPNHASELLVRQDDEWIIRK
ncbi:MAG: UDP-N-acetylmuramoyl-tripeptide--D-alanyl-D-alanine ligase [Candidatus Pacebacteria bacterium]|nr:UDP-N-acetylmuramoyl-tripeptide--D-alanyl-D-alanine ligase [Candidatus Paceibacterota bacterium]MBP9843031.1 UDP-N-acetylmuramoyl-tripeptide--D-alanyl-D-alanine ligase [Candidatus Paceibacterota bacterium]